MISRLPRLGWFLPKDQFARSVAQMVGGTALGQGVVILSSPLLTRLYTPEEFGLLAVFSSILSVALVLVSFRYEYAIPLPVEDDQAADLLSLSVLLVLGTSVLGVVAFWWLSEEISVWTRTPQLASYIWFLPIGLLGGGLYQAFNYWITRQKLFSVVSRTKVIQGFGQVLIQLIAGTLKFGATGLLTGFIVGKFLGVGALMRRSFRVTHVSSWSRIRIVAKKYRSFALYTVGAGVVNMVGMYIPNIQFARYFDLEKVGFFFLTQRILTVPMALIGQSVAQVFYPVAAQSQSDLSQSRHLIERLATVLLFISFSTFSVVSLQGPFLFASVFGPAWQDAGHYAQYLAPWYVCSFISSPLSSFVLVAGKQRSAFFMTLYESGLRLGSIWLGSRYGSPELAVLLFSASGVLISIVYIGWILNLTGTNLISWVGQLRNYFLAGMLLVVGLSFLGEILSPAVALGVDMLILGIFSIVNYMRVCRNNYV
ncbi:oligosaccharide flippase family protein [Moorella sp. Hama-1]|uniref:oligosaccharide flippase family protein n=1 Tax=Moorella sp. Hama-1 TaxID=2138101 RepID=UPI000D65AEB1|nr:oligosaccharide flippase family protein [Moorella sp. Hama-1]